MGSLEKNPLAVKLLDNRLYIHERTFLLRTYMDPISPAPSNKHLIFKRFNFNFISLFGHTSFILSIHISMMSFIVMAWNGGDKNIFFRKKIEKNRNFRKRKKLENETNLLFRQKIAKTKEKKVCQNEHKNFTTYQVQVSSKTDLIPAHMCGEQ